MMTQEWRKALKLCLISTLCCRKLAMSLKSITALCSWTILSWGTPSRTRPWPVWDRDPTSGGSSASQHWSNPPARPAPLTGPPPAGSAAHTQAGVSAPSAPTRPPLHHLSQVTSQDTHITSHHQSHVLLKELFMPGDVPNVTQILISTQEMEITSATKPKLMK